MIDRLRDNEFDVLVIGGGITGVGGALDAASRGLRTALVERDDFASGTSSSECRCSLDRHSRPLAIAPQRRLIDKVSSATDEWRLPGDRRR